MPRFTRVVLATAICCAAHAAHAQSASDERPFYIGILGGAEVPTGTYSGGSSHQVAGLFGLELLFPVPESHLAARADVAFHQFTGATGMNGTNCVYTAQVPGGNACDTNPIHGMVTLGGSIAARLFDRDAFASPYVMAGFAVRGAINGVNAQSSPTGGLQYGIGLEGRPGNRAIVFVEWRHIEMGSGGYSAVLIGARF